MKKLTKLMLVLAQLGLAGALQAATVSLDPASQVIQPNSSVSVNVLVDFSDTSGTKGGFFTLGYDSSLLTFSSFVYNTAFLTPFGANPTAWNLTTPGTITNVGFGSGLLTGSGTLGTVTFLTGASVGTANLTTTLASGFLNKTGFSMLPVSYSGAQVNVAAVPVPAAAWLMASGISMLGLGLRRRSV